MLKSQTPRAMNVIYAATHIVVNKFSDVISLLSE